MSNVGWGLDSEAIEMDPSVAQLQAQAQGVAAAVQVALPATGFVASVNALGGLLTIQPGSSSPGVTVVVVTDGVSVISIGVTGITAPGVAKSNVAAVPPTPTNDEFENYARFSLWIDTVGQDVYMCIDPATAAAVWVQLN